MSVKRRTDKIHSVMFEYTGTDKEFNEFLKLMLHDYLAVDHPGTSTKEIVGNVESSVA